MSSNNKHGESLEEISSYRDFEKLLKYLILIGIIVVSGFIIYYVLKPNRGYVSFGILNSDKEASNYPTSVGLGENVSFYLTIDNYLNRVFRFRIELLKGNSSIISRPSNPLTSQSVLNTSVIILENQQSWISDLFDISFNEIGENHTIIAELWEFEGSLPGNFYTSLFLRLNITS